MNADAAVMEFMPKRLTAEESDVLADRIQKRLAERGFGLFAAELRETGGFIGFVGISAENTATGYLFTINCVAYGNRYHSVTSG